MTCPRAADDFAVIRARIEELRRASVPLEPEARPLPPRPYHTESAVTPKADPRRLDGDRLRLISPLPWPCRAAGGRAKSKASTRR
jgi:hypothetical protein